MSETPDHSGAKRFRAGNTTAQTVERANVGYGETEEIVHPHLPHDAFYMDPEQLAERGMGNAVYACVADLVHPPGHPQAGEFVFPGDRVIVSVTPPAVADRVGPDILTKKKLARKSFEFARDESGNLVPSTEDQVFATYDRDEYLNKGKRSTRYHNEQCKDFYMGLKERELITDKAKDGAFRNFNDSQLEAAKHAAHGFMQGISGARYPKSMSLQRIEEEEGADNIMATEHKYARHKRSLAEFKEWAEAQGEAAARKPAKARSVSFPGSPTK